MQKPTASTFAQLLDHNVAMWPEHEALVDGGKRWTFAQLQTTVWRTAHALEHSGIGHGDRVGILAGNCAEWLIVYFACMELGAIPVGLNTWATARELAYQLEHAQVRLLFIETRVKERDFLSLLDDARDLANGLPALEHVVVLDPAPSTTIHTTYTDWLSSHTDAATDKRFRPKTAVTSNDVACLLYTSGSTALPKGVPLLHGGLINNMWSIGERQHLQPDDRLWLAVSLFWSLACVNAVFAALTHGTTVVLQHQFEAGAALNLIESERCTVFYGTPNMVLALSEDPGFAQHKPDTLRTGVTIGTPAQIQHLVDLGVPHICNVYGLTEAYGNSTVTDAELPLQQRLTTVGQALEGVQVSIVDPVTRTHLEAEVAGEIVLRGNVTPGYWNAPERTAEAFTDDGWFLTGDLGLLDKQGFLYYRGRVKEMVKTGGINVAPAEVEEILCNHPAVELAFVTGLPDPRLDEALAALIITRPGSNTTEDELRHHCRAAMASYKTPRRFRFIQADALPLTSTGKLQRNRLAELFS